MNPKHQGLAILFLLSSFFYTISVSAQSRETAPNNLTPEQQLETLPHDSSRIRPLFIIANSYLYSDSTKTLRYLKEGLELARKFNRQNAICTFLLLWAEVYNAQGKFDAALPILEQAHEVAVRNHNANLIATYEQLRGVICNETGDYPGAIAHDIEYIKQGEAVKDTQMIMIGLANVCVAYQNEKNNDKTVEYARKILEYPYSPRNALSVSKALEMIASVYIEQHKYTQAQDSLKKAFQLYAAEKNENGMAIIYTSLAACYPNDPYHNLEYALPAQELWEKLGPDNGYAISNLGNLGAVYTNLARIKLGLLKDSSTFATVAGPGNPQSAAARALYEAAKLNATALKAKAGAYYLQALDRATKTSNREVLVQISDSLSSLEALDGRYKDAYFHLKQHQILYDSVYSQDNKNHVAGIEADYKVELSDKQLQLNKLELSSQIKIKWLLISSLSLTLLVLGLIFWQSRLRKKNNASLSALNKELNETNLKLNEANSRLEDANSQLEAANRVKTQFFAILNHDLRRPVASLITLLNLHQQDPEVFDEQVVKARTGQLTQAAEDLLETMEDLLIWSKGQMERFRPNMKPVLVASLFADVEKKFASEKVSMTFDQPAGLSIISDRDFTQTILRNLTGNAVKALTKHFGGTESNATPHPYPGKIAWKAWEDPEGVRMSIIDNGPGATPEQLNPLFDEEAVVGLGSGLGLHIIRDMAKAIGCEIESFSPQEGGLGIRLLWPREDATQL